MAYRYDPDLEFLKTCSAKELNDLVYCLTHDEDGKTRWTEELTTKDAYKQFYPKHNMYWEDIAGEIQCFGANTFVTLFRGGKGVLYKEVLSDVCDKMKVNYNKNSSAEQIEQNLLMKILTDSLDKMSASEIEELSQSIGVKNITGLGPQALAAVFQAVFKAGGFKSYQLTLIVVNAVMKAVMGRGLTFAANATLAKTMAMLTGPIGWTITAAWTLIDVGGAAYRVTVPAVVQVAYLRSKKQAGLID